MSYPHRRPHGYGGGGIRDGLIDLHESCDFCFIEGSERKQAITRDYRVLYDDYLCLWSGKRTDGTWLHRYPPNERICELLNHAMLDTAAPLFEKMFDLPLKKCWDKLVGFDPVAMDKKLKLGDRALGDWVVEKAGQDGLRFIEALNQGMPLDLCAWLASFIWLRNVNYNGDFSRHLKSSAEMQQPEYVK